MKKLKKVERAINTDEVAEPNILAIQAFEAATKSKAWLDKLLNYLSINKHLIIKQLNLHIPEIKIIKSNATYLIWLDCKNICDDSSVLCNYIKEKTGLILTPGEVFKGNGKQFIRWNFACSKKLLKMAIKKFISAIKDFKSYNLKKEK
ncbi:hypothetical protein [Spiroplasma tabanidicola]|uniref:hypothetical protein n=1 Tax=Spiroplasma tabanidicola TaxID=324079 RepID=UPI001B860AFE|nr:hypothetical protein [Spiroplasma tabanidicola]